MGRAPSASKQGSHLSVETADTEWFLVTTAPPLFARGLYIFVEQESLVGALPCSDYTFSSDKTASKHSLLVEMGGVEPPSEETRIQRFS